METLPNRVEEVEGKRIRIVNGNQCSAPARIKLDPENNWEPVIQ